MKNPTFLIVMLVAGSVFAQEDCNLQYDGNGDGAVNITDVLGVLSEFGEECEPTIEYGPCGIDSTISYHGYNYSLVEIGEQCWFAENLRTEQYANGDSINSLLTDSEWSSTTSGALAVYGEGSVCEAYYAEDEVCDPEWSLNEYGRLYNWYAVEDERGLCPTGWHVPTDGEWTISVDFLGGGGMAGNEMKSTYGWYNGGNGTNSSGFLGLPGGYREPTSGVYLFAGNSGFWWSSSPDPYDADEAEYQNLYYVDSGAYYGTALKKYGFSVRCLKDSE